MADATPPQPPSPDADEVDIPALAATARDVLASIQRLERKVTGHDTGPNGHSSGIEDLEK